MGASCVEPFSATRVVEKELDGIGNENYSL